MKTACRLIASKGIDPDSQDGISICLNCTLAQCKLDNPYIYAREKKVLRALELQSHGLDKVEIATIMRKSLRQIERYLKYGRLARKVQ